MSDSVELFVKKSDSTELLLYCVNLPGTFLFKALDLKGAMVANPMQVTGKL